MFKNFTLLALSTLAIQVNASEASTEALFNPQQAAVEASSHFNGDYRSLVLCESTSTHSNQKRFADLIEDYTQLDPIFSANLPQLRELSEAVQLANESMVQEFGLICNRFMNSSEHIQNEKLAESILIHKNFIVSTAFGLIAHELQINGRLDEAEDIVDFYVEADVPYAKIMKAGFSLEKGHIQEALDLALEVADEGLAIAHLTIGAIFQDVGEIEKAYAWMSLGLEGVVRTHSELYTRIEAMESEMTHEQLVKANLFKDTIAEGYPVKVIAQ